MPWLIGTAFLHSVMIQEKRGMLKVWNVSLVLATGVLAILGTFLVRSGILNSIHAFGASTLGIPFLVLIGVMIAGSIALVVSRAPDLRSEHKLDSLLSREAIFLLNNLVLVGLCFVIFWGTFFPLISEALTGNEASVGPPWFDRYIVPLALVLVLLSGIGPVIAWRHATAANLRRNLVRPAAVGVAVVVLLLLAGVSGSVPALLMFGLASFVVAAVGQELWRGVRARRAMSDDSVPRALVQLVRRNRRRYGGYIVHVGVSVLFAGVAASSAFQAAHDVQLGVGQTTKVGGYDITYVKPTGDLRAANNGRLEKIDLGAVMRVSRDGKTVGTLRTEKSFFPTEDPSLGPISRFFEGEATSEVGLRAGLLRDVWSAISPNVRDLRKQIAEGDKVFTKAKNLPASHRDILLAKALVGLTNPYSDTPTPATFRLIVSPLVSWIWIGALIVFCGGLIALWPAPRRAPRPVAARYAARVAHELGRAERHRSGRAAGPGGVRRRRARGERAAAARARGGGRRLGGGGARRARGRKGGQVRRDPRRRARLPHRQALRGGLAGAGPRAARGGDRDPPPPRRPLANPPTASPPARYSVPGDRKGRKRPDLRLGSRTQREGRHG